MNIEPSTETGVYLATQLVILTPQRDWGRVYQGRMTSNMSMCESVNAIASDIFDVIF